MKRFFKQHTHLYGGAMEPETIQKNGASPKSQTSRGNSINSMYIKGLVMSICFVTIAMPVSANIPVGMDVSNEMACMADIDPETVSIPKYDEISSRWLDDSGRDRYKKVVWYGAVEGYIYIDKDGDIYIKINLGDKYWYETEKDAINALYVWKKYDKIRKTGKL